MICVSRLNRQQLTINADLIERIEAAPDTTIRLITGESLVVREDVAEVVRRIVDYRSRLLAGAGLPALVASGVSQTVVLLEALRRVETAHDFESSSRV